MASKKASKGDPRAQAVESAVDDIMVTIDEDHFASNEVSREMNIDFYNMVASQCRDRVATIKSEMGEAEEDDDDVGTDSEDDPEE